MSHRCPILLFMMLTDARQATAAANRMRATVSAGACGLDELREALAESRAFIAAGTAFQTAAAELIAARERHGDGGVEVLASSAGLPQREAHSQVATAAALQKVPKLRDAVQAGDIPQANARRLADAITKTGSAAVAGDAGLLAQAKSMRPEQFAKTAQRWIGAQQADDGTTEYLRQRARRYLKIYDTEDGMIALHGEFDKITGTRLRNRLSHTAGRLLAADKKLPEAQRRKFPQCMADALEHCTTHPRHKDAAAASTRAAGLGMAPGLRMEPSCNAETRNKDAASGASTAGCGTGAAPNSNVCECAQQPRSANSATSSGCATCSADASLNAADASFEDAGSSDTGSADEGSGASWSADITVLAHVDDTTGELIAEMSDGSRLPATVLEELSCNARWTGLVFDRAGDAIWRSRSRRTVTDTQWQTLLAKHGGCFHCAAPPGMCQAHHITPYAKGGATNLDNLIMVCWNCHHKIHHHNWRIHEHADGSHSLHPPDNPATQPRYGPAHADDAAPQPPRTPNRAQKDRSRTEVRARDPALW